MRVESKFLTADVRITAVSLKERHVVVEGLVKEFMPMTVYVGLDDLRLMAHVLLQPVRDRIERYIPKPLRSRLPVREPEAA